MTETIITYLEDTLHLSQGISMMIYYGALTLVILILCFIANEIGKRVVLTSVSKLVGKTATNKDETFYNRKVFHVLVYYIPIMVAYLFSNLYLDFAPLVQKLLMVATLIVTIVVIFRALDALNDIYNEKEFAKSMPIKGMLQVVKIIVLVFAGFILLIGFSDTTSAVAILGSLGGMSAVVLLIFRDSILGFVAGIQLSVNGLLKIGDWIEMPKYQADGEVVDVSLTKISVRNWDKTISHIPAYKFIEESFVNWDNMSKSGGRRIKRNILIDVNSIGFLSDDAVKALENIDFMKDYFMEKEKELSLHNGEVKGQHPITARRLTNLGTFRAYVELYLRNHPHVKQDDTLLVRQREAEGNGLPIQIYCFTNDTRWAYYEGIQSDIFDHLYAVIEMFDLKAYQAPSGRDFQNLVN